MQLDKRLWERAIALDAELKRCSSRPSWRKLRDALQIPEIQARCISFALSNKDVLAGMVDDDTVAIPPPPAAEAKPSFADILSMGSDLAPEEIDLIVKSAKRPPAPQGKASVSWGANCFKFAVVSDTHIGHIKSSAEWWEKACDRIGKEKCQVVFHPGDISEGMSGRQGHVYELDALGMTAQLDLTVQRFNQCPVPIHGITGNHDAWTFKAVGVDFGTELASRIPGQFVYLGPDEADVTIDGVTIKLWHGGDGASYATSYRTQKFVEGLTGGEKPHILLSGHAHKSIFHACRNVMVFEAGTLCGQTAWMRGKKLAAHVGFWIIEVWPAKDGGIERIKQEWIPFFTEGAS